MYMGSREKERNFRIQGKVFMLRVTSSTPSLLSNLRLSASQSGLSSQSLLAINDNLILLITVEIL